MSSPSRIIPFTGGGGGGGGSAADVAFTPAGNIAAENVQLAVQELDTEKADVNDSRIVTSAAAIDATDEPSGFEDRTTSTITLTDNGADYTFEIAPTGASFWVWIQGARQEKTAETLTVAKTTGTTFIYYNDVGILTQSMTPWTLGTDTPIALIYHSTTAGAAVMCEERHGCQMPSSVHQNLHTTRGAQRGQGLTLGDYTLAGTVDANNRWSVSSGTVHDEDIIHSLTGLAAGGPYFVMRRVGATEWTWSAETDPFITTGGDLAYNRLNAGTWEQAAVTNNNFCNYWVFAWGTTELVSQILVIQGQNLYSTLAAAQGATIEANLDVSLYPFIECVPRYQITMKLNNGLATVGHAQIAAVTELVGRSLAIASQTAATNHATLAGRDLADQHPASSITFTPVGTVAAVDVQSALAEVVGEKLDIAGTSDITGVQAFRMATAGQDIVQARVTTELQPRFILNADGKLEWGPGATTAVDTYLQRVTTGSGGTLMQWVATDKSIASGTALVVGSASGYGVPGAYITTRDSSTLGLANYNVRLMAPLKPTVGTTHCAMVNTEGSITTNYVHDNLSVFRANAFSALSGTGSVANTHAIYAEPSTFGTTNWGVRVIGTPHVGIGTSAASTASLWISTDVDSTTAAGGIAFGLSRDVTLYRLQASVLAVGGALTASNTISSSGAFTCLGTSGGFGWATAGASTNAGFMFRAAGDTNYRFQSLVDGTISWGPGDGAVDTNLYRSAANTLKTDDAFVIAGSYLAVGTNPSSAGAIRLPNNTFVMSRNAANSGDVYVMGVNAADDTVVVANAANKFQIQLGGGNPRFEVSNTQAKFYDVPIELGTTTGTKIGTANTQKLGFWNATPVVQDTGWTVSNVSTDRVLDANATSLDELADVVGTLITTLTTYGLLGA